MYLVAFDVIADLQRGGCPLCRAAAGAGREWVRSLMRQDVTDASVGSGLDEEGGICARHIRLAADIAAQERDEYGLALLSELLLSVAGRRLKAAARPGVRRRLRGTPRTVGPRRCPACAAEQRKAMAYLEILADALVTEKAELTVPAGRAWLCLPHLDTALARQSDLPGVQKLVEATLRRVGVLAAEVDGDLRRFAQHADATPFEHRGSVDDAVRWLGGE